MHGRHKTLDKSLKSSIKFVKSLDGVKKIVLGFSESCRHRYSPGHIKIRSKVDGGIKVNAYSGKGVTDVFIRISPEDLIDFVISKIEENFQSSASHK